VRPERGVLASRRSGVLLHFTSLPSRYGRGDLGHEAYRFIEFLARSGCSVWQVLPMGPTHEDGSPYNALSVHAGNPLLISLDWLYDRGFLGASVLDQVAAGECSRLQALAQAALRFRECVDADPALRADFADFCRSAAHWLEDYALYAAVRTREGGRPWYDWEPALRDRDPAALRALGADVDALLQRLRFEQYVFYRQWAGLRDYAHSHGVFLFGDIPIFVAHDSADVWAHRACFRLDADGHPLTVAGVPPDYFSAVGQRWGNPHYDWDYMAGDGFRWWRHRVATQRCLFDLVRIDHFRGFEACWEIPREAETAVTGRWVKAPGEKLLAALLEEVGEGVLVAENLGIITAEVEALREGRGLPGMLILQFAFDGDPQNPYLPHNHETLDVVYTGTHDNDTTLGWYQSLDEAARASVLGYLGYPADSMPWPLVRCALASVALLAVIPFQDLLGLDATHRMNRPGIAAGNWRWQFQAAQVPDDLADRLLGLNRRYGRCR
jgi:4-alpha-glucanotransferase